MQPPYRVYLRNPKGRIVGREDFDAADDHAAMTIAEQLRDACSDLCVSFELWNGSRRVDAFPRLVPRLDAAGISAATQEAVVLLEERLLESRWTIADSQRLLEQSRRLMKGAD